jgi:hypothetical protein
MTTWDLLITRGWLLGWMAIVPVAAMVAVWVVALYSDRMESDDTAGAAKAD